MRARPYRANLCNNSGETEEVDEFSPYFLRIFTSSKNIQSCLPKGRLSIRTDGVHCAYIAYILQYALPSTPIGQIGLNGHIIDACSGKASLGVRVVGVKTVCIPMLFCQMHNSNGTLICVCTEVHAYNVVVVAAVSAFD